MNKVVKKSLIILVNIAVIIGSIFVIAFVMGA
jgi:hypothetical protein